MKTLTALFALLFSLNASAMAELAFGDWQLNQRICTDGTPAHDAFQLGRDHVYLTIRPNHPIAIEEKINGTTTFSKAYFTPFGTISSDPQGTELDPYMTTFGDRLMIVSGGFGPHGSCAVDQELISIFVRRK